MTLADAIREAAEHLSATSDTARLDAELLMAHAHKVSRSDLLLRGMAIEAWNAPDGFWDLVERRARREPMAYILGYADFYDRDFYVTPDVLIPRPDSESLVDAALAAAPSAKRILDMGTGSGALLIILLRKLKHAIGVGIDASEAALAIAERNAARNSMLEKRAKFFCRDWTVPDWSEGLGKFDLVICNPPYVEDDAELDPDVRDYEPASALFAGPEGLDDYRVIVPKLGKLLLPGGLAVLEIGWKQADAVSTIARESGFETELRHDLAGRPRALILR